MAKTVDPEILISCVYDLAQGIGKDFEDVINLCGIENTRDLMAKVIITLEYLEASSGVVERLQNELFEIKTKVEQLEREKIERAEFRKKIDEEIELIEENWRKESNHLNALVVRLQQENIRLSKIITEKETHSPNDCKAFMSDEELLVVQKLKELAEQHRAQLILKDKELLEKNNQVEKVLLENENLNKGYKEVCQRNKSLSKQLYTLLEEKSDLQANMQNKEKECQELQTQLNYAVKENIDLASAEDRSKQVDLHGKLIVHLDDPNRPRFTLDELRHILFERNDLKAKVSDLEEELNLHLQKCITGSLSLNSLKINELPVQGPINQEPEEKLYPEKKKLGIRRFFPSVNWPKLV